MLVADPKYAHKVKQFPPNVVPESEVGNAYFYKFFKSAGIISRPAWFGNNGTDSLSFSFVGVPDTGILTNQDCCKHSWEVALWGGFRGNYEGTIPSHNGGCVDYPHRWCDNLSNNDPFVFELSPNPSPTSRLCLPIAASVGNVCHPEQREKMCHREERS